MGPGYGRTNLYGRSAVTRLSRFAAALGSGIALSLVLPLAAQAVTREVTQGLPTKVQQTRAFLGQGGHDIDAIDFFPHTVTIHVGDKIHFSQTAFHQLDIPAIGQKRLVLLVQKGTVGHVVGKDGNPFWYSDSPFPNFGFNNRIIKGHPTVDYSPTKEAAKHGTHKTYDGSRRILTPIPFNAGPKPITIKFTRAGTFRYFCDLHPGENGVVRVLPKSEPIPSAKAYKRALNRQIRRDRRIANHIHNHRPKPVNTVNVGYAGRHHVEIFRYLPQTLRIKVGTTVRFQITPRSVESHTATTAGPHNPETSPNTTIGTIAASFFAPKFDPRGVYPSEPFGTIATLTKSSHGEGFWNSGVLDNQNRGFTKATPTFNLVKFGQAGTYDFYCMVHPQMHGRVVVTQ
jgi:plastocyanin